MKKLRTIFLSPVIAIVVMAAMCMTGCTKADYGDDFKTSSPPPIGDYNVSDDVAADALVAKWSYENTFDDAIQHLTGVNTGAGFGAGIKGQGYQGTDASYIVFKQPGTIPTLHAFSVSFWMNTGGTLGLARGIFSLNNKTDFWGSLDIYLENFSSPDTANFKVHLGSNVGGSSIGQFAQTYIPKAINRWINIIITYDDASSIFNIYANSQQLPINVGPYSNVRGPVLLVGGLGTAPYGPLDFVGNNATAIVMGTWQFQPNDPDITSTGSQPWAGSFKGTMDEFRIYNRALTTGEVSALFRLEKLGQ